MKIKKEKLDNIIFYLNQKAELSSMNAKSLIAARYNLNESEAEAIYKYWRKRYVRGFFKPEKESMPVDNRSNLERFAIDYSLKNKNGFNKETIINIVNTLNRTKSVQETYKELGFTRNQVIAVSQAGIKYGVIKSSGKGRSRKCG